MIEHGYCSITVDNNDETWLIRFVSKIYTQATFGFKIPNSKKNFHHLHGDLNLDEIKNTLQLLSVNGEMNLIDLIRLQLDAKLLQ